MDNSDEDIYSQFEEIGTSESEYIPSGNESESSSVASQTSNYHKNEELSDFDISDFSDLEDEMNLQSQKINKDSQTCKLLKNIKLNMESEDIDAPNFEIETEPENLSIDDEIDKVASELTRITKTLNNEVTNWELNKIPCRVTVGKLLLSSGSIFNFI
ncbi:uncharacterized protein LOC131673112 [Phymastichus coffea]|uniref:uncharacterized protein LOC131673112 n=1 Tax=Phymastichus coffea TaxID=108790 RepID=UPI00273C964B|nr:uncharacterized protein LOC131673112 [Phymastichus coffea]